MKFFLPAVLILLWSFADSGRIAGDRNNGSLPGNGIYRDTTVTRFFQRTTGCVAGDGGYSVPLANNKVLWLMGDSHIDDYNPATKTVPCLFQVRNTALLQPANDWTKGNTKTLTGTYRSVKSYLKKDSSDQFFWPGAGIQLRDTAYVYCSSLMNQGTGAFGFAPAGNDYIASIKVPEMKVAGYHALPDLGGIGFGVAFLRSGEWVYVYGQKYIAHKMRCELYVARFAADASILKWTFWNGSSWTERVRDAKVIASQTGVSGTFHVCRIKDKILLLSSELSINCDSGTEMYTAVSDHLTGPFSQKKLLYAIDDRLNGHSPFFYSVIAHPEYINKKDELLVTYAINGYGSCVADCVNGRMDPDVYRLRAIRVPCEVLFKEKM